MVRGHSKVKRIERGVRGHEPVLDVSVDDLRHRWSDLEQRQFLGQRKGSLSARVLAVPQLKKNGLACHECIALVACSPPAPGPGAASQRFSS